MPILRARYLQLRPGHGFYARGQRIAFVLALLVSALPGWADSGNGQVVDIPVDPSELGIRTLPTYLPTDPPENARALYRDSTISVNTQCPVRGGRIDPSRDPVYVNGRPVGFCCHPCPSTFSFDPEKYLRQMKVTLQCPVRPARRAILDSSLRTRINQDFYFFSSAAAMKQFKKDPLRFTGKLTDPVSHARFRPKKTSPRVTYRGAAYYFASDSTLTQFQAKPERYAERQTGT
jgi:YHS domain-containing protein